MASSRKKAIVRKLNSDWIAGYLPPSNLLENGSLEMLGLDGKILPLDAEDLKWICYVRDFNSGEITNPERLLRKTFAGRPRTEGLFLRVHLKDGDLIEGLASNDLGLITSQGLFLTPPDVRSNTQRIWVPVSALAQLEVVAVIGKTKKKTSALPAAQEKQEKLF